MADKPKQLLVEGKSELHVFLALCMKYKVPQTFDIKSADCITNLLMQVSPVLKRSDLETLGIVIDADYENNGKWGSLSAKLKSHGYVIPDQLPQQGLIITQEGLPKLSVWIMPDNQSKGMLEDFVKYLIPENDKLYPIVIDTLEKVKDQGLQLFIDNHHPKALIHTWLAWQQTPGLPMGTAITANFLNNENDCCIAFIDWLNNSFN